jgi:chromosome segregation ATPase
MPLGLWKSKWEIHREDMERLWAEVDRQHAEWREERAKIDAEFRDMRGRSDEIGEETRDLRADYDREVAEARLFNRELLIRLEKTYTNLGATLELMGERIAANTEEVKAQTEAILKLVDRFEDPEGRPPV